MQPNAHFSPNNPEVITEFLNGEKAFDEDLGRAQEGGDAEQMWDEGREGGLSRVLDAHLATNPTLHC